VTYTIPEKVISVDTAGLSGVKIPLKVAILLPDENYTLTKTWVNPAAESNTMTQTIPFGKLMKNAAQNIFPAVFDRADMFTGKSYPSGVDLICTPSIKDFSFEPGAQSLSQQTLIAQLHLKNTVTDAAGNVLFSDETATETKKTFQAVYSESAYIDNWADVMASAVNDTLLKATRSLADSGEIRAYAKNRSGDSGGPPQPAGTAPTGAVAQPPVDLASVRVKLKDAFEKGAISVEQLSRALEEGGRTPRSKILDAFLEDKIDAKKFGELY